MCRNETGTGVVRGERMVHVPCHAEAMKRMIDEHGMYGNREVVLLGFWTTVHEKRSRDMRVMTGDQS